MATTRPKLSNHGDISTAEESAGLAAGKKPVIRGMTSRKAERPDLPKAGDSLSPLSYDSSPPQKCKGSVNVNKAPEAPGTSTKSVHEVSPSPNDKEKLGPAEASARGRGTVGTKEGANDPEGTREVEGTETTGGTREEEE